MSKEIAKKLIAELQTNEELKAKIVGIEDRTELVKKAVEMGYDVTLDELMEAEKEYRKEFAENWKPKRNTEKNLQKIPTQNCPQTSLKAQRAVRNGSARQAPTVMNWDVLFLITVTGGIK